MSGFTITKPKPCFTSLISTGVHSFTDSVLVTSYPSPYFTQTNTGTTTTLVMLGNENIATIQEGNVLWNHTDHLGSTVATTDIQGNTVEQTKYSSFGHQISRSTFQNTSQTEKYTGHTYDPETDLLYAQARYYRGGLGRFLGQDPLHWNLPQEYLLDPQQQNSYSYGRNNPMKFIDITGNKIEAINRPVTILGTHSFIQITDNPNINNGQRTTLGGYTTNFLIGDLFKAENYYTDYDLKPEQYLKVHEIKPVNGMSQQEFEEKVYSKYQQLNTWQGAYGFSGGDFSSQGNSGNLFTQILINAGVPNDEIITFVTPYKYNAGIGRQLPSEKRISLNTRVEQIKSTLTNTANAAVEKGKSVISNLKNRYAK